MGWWSPLRRGVLLPGDFHVSRSLRRSARQYDVTIDEAFTDVVIGCADPARSGRWITREVISAYGTLHDLGWAHSIEVWSGRQLVGGLYGVAIGGLFAGESMFHRAPDASKVALWTLAELCFEGEAPGRVIDVQWQTPHLASLGVREIPRADYLAALPEVLEQALPSAWSGQPGGSGAHQICGPVDTAGPRD